MQMSSKRKSTDAPTSVTGKAFGPAAEDFGKAIRPLGSEVGTISVRAVRTLLQPLSALVWGFEKIEGWVAEAVAPKVERIPPEHRAEPKLIVAGPTLDAMRYCGSEPHLRDMFATLLASAMDARVASLAHPAFVDMIRQLSPDEAKILAYMGRRFFESYTLIEAYRTWPALDDDGKPSRSGARVFGPYSRVGYYAGCQQLKGIPPLIGNLARLKIVEMTIPFKVAKEDLEDLLADEIISNFRGQIESERDRLRDKSAFAYTTGIMEITPLGQQFLDACVRQRNAT